MSEEEKVEMAKEIVEREEREVKPKKEKWNTKDYVDKMLNQSMMEMEGMRKAEEKHKHEEKHNHATHTNDSFCPGCGERNPDFKAKQARCTACGQDVGTKEEIETGKVKFCRNCGSENATIEGDE